MAQSQVLQNYNQRPLSFEANRGQTNKAVKFLARGQGYSLFLLQNQAVLLFSQDSSNDRYDQAFRDNRDRVQATSNSTIEVLRMQLEGAERQSAVTGENELAGKVNYLLGRGPAKWHSNIPTYARVRYSRVYPGVDLVYYGNQRRLEYDFIVAPGADPGQIRLQFNGAEKLRVNGDGDLLLQTSSGTLAFRKPAIYQTIEGQRSPMQGSFKLLSRNTVGFSIGRYDRSQPLIIDPVLVYSTYLGGSGNDVGNAIAVDSAGNAYVAGTTEETDFPTSSGAFQKVNNRSGTNPSWSNAFVTKFDSNGSLVYSTYLGGSAYDGAQAIAVDSSGNAYVTGYTASPDFPTTSGAFQTVDKAAPATGGGNQLTAFVTKLNSSGSGLVYSTYLGGSKDDAAIQESNGQEEGYGIAVDGSGNAFVTGETYAIDFPVTSGAFQPQNNWPAR